MFEKPTELWAQLVTMGGASSVRQVQPGASGTSPTPQLRQPRPRYTSDCSPFTPPTDIPAGKFDVVVTDQACPPLLEKNMASQEVPLVSPEWLIQSVICGERLGFHSLPRYRHNYTP